MAGGGTLGGGPKQKRGKNSKRKSKKRVGFVLDMTPLVDITFLLLTFFMLTTTLATPQVMEMKIPPEQTDVKVRESELFTILADENVEKDGVVYCYSGQNIVEVVKLKDLINLSVKNNIDVKNKLITVLKVSDNAPYGAAVGLLDQLNLAEVEIIKQLSSQQTVDGLPFKRDRKFTLAKFEEADLKKINEVRQ